MKLFALAQPQLDLDAAVLEIKRERDERDADAQRSAKREIDRTIKEKNY